MTMYLLMCRSLTHAQRSARVLIRAEIPANVIKAPQALSRNGCGFCVRISEFVKDALQLLQQAGLSPVRIYEVLPGGKYSEVSP